MNLNLINLIGLLLGIAGTIVLGLSLKDFVKSVRLLAIEVEVIILSSQSSCFKSELSGAETHVTKAAQKSNKFTWIGFALVIAGFALQILQYLPVKW